MLRRHKVVSISGVSRNSCLDLKMAHAANTGDKDLNGLDFPLHSLLGVRKVELAEERYEGSADLFYAMSVDI